jgi:WD40 repeat protein
VWVAGTGRAVRVLEGHTGEVNGVSFSPDGAILATAGDDNTTRLWKVETGEQLAALRGTAEGWFAFTPKGKYKLVGPAAGHFWYAINLCRFEPGELDEFLPPGTLTCLAPDDPLWSA